MGEVCFLSFIWRGFMLGCVVFLLFPRGYVFVGGVWGFVLEIVLWWSLDYVFFEV
jgi:hypothetical protein